MSMPELATSAENQEREKERFEDLIRPLIPALLAYFVRRVEPEQEAPDCLSNTLTILWRKRNDLPSEDDHLKAFCFRIAQGILANQRRGKIRKAALLEKLRAQMRPSTIHEHTPTPIAESVLDALDQLPDRDKQLVMLIAWDGFGVAQAGALLNLSASAARSRYSRSRATMRRLLTDLENVDLTKDH
jgi:RNA polymerase sigma factor (sigma-70 family)